MKQENLNEMPTKGTETTTIHNSNTFPFLIVEKTTTKDEKEQKEFMIAVNNQLMTADVFNSIEDAEDYIDSKAWDLIINLIGLTIQMMKNNETESK